MSKKSLSLFLACEPGGSHDHGHETTADVECNRPFALWPYSVPFKYQDENPIIIGGNTNSKGKTWVDCFHGRISDVRLYNRALNQEEVLQLRELYSYDKPDM